MSWTFHVCFDAGLVLKHMHEVGLGWGVGALGEEHCGRQADNQERDHPADGNPPDQRPVDSAVPLQEPHCNRGPNLAVGRRQRDAEART